MKGKTRTTTRRKKGRGDWEDEEIEEEEFTVPEMVEAIMEALADNEPLGKGGWHMSQSTALGRLDPGHKFEIIDVGCTAELHCPNKPSAVEKTIDICMAIVEEKVHGKIDEIEALFEDDDDD